MRWTTCQQASTCHEQFTISLTRTHTPRRAAAAAETRPVVLSRVQGRRRRVLVTLQGALLACAAEAR